MAKERAAKLHTKAEKPEKKHEKKVSKDKVKKHKKEEKKTKPVNVPEELEDEPSKLEDTSAVVEESSAEPEPEVKPKKEKKAKKQSEEKVEKSKKKEEEKSKKAAAKEEAVAESDEEDNGAPLFAIDTEPTPIDPKSIPEKAGAADDDNMHREKGGKQKEEEKGLNRQARRRLRLIERQRDFIHKQLGVAVGSSERADEVQALLDRWVKDYDAKARARAAKKELRTAKNVARIRKKRDMMLKAAADRRKPPRGLSAQHAA
ncbi:uncharacterized protein F4812DRAFT_460603 [Daldinia caldariorum]|uniref:uncharacterized protein n=1 Tax=Daldinia caldariorum TaxID=326644 RepID=UPI0020089335|nr:uncharacterized protein F4812DRAFT_460603 [Daldinia caldariorum]KAI1466328.1 hypothetical protein F4812DRAFT_460603 [Daldinia caldariorum]